MKIKIFPVILFVVIFIAGIAGTMPLNARTDKLKILIMPFNIQADKNNNYDFLKKGISQMLHSRLDIPGASIPVSPGTKEASTADSTLSGNISILKSSISTSAKLVDTKTGKILLDFKKTGKSKSDILRHINLLSRRIKTDILHIKPIDNFGSEELENNEGKKKNAASPEQPLWNSRAFNKNFISMSITDINGDSKNEIIVATENEIYIYLRKGAVLHEITDFKIKKNTKIISVDAGDINGNKKAEIYVTCIDQNTDRPSSFVMEWTGTRLTKILDNQDWLFRIIKTKTRGTMLVGQIPGSGDAMLDSKVSQLKWEKMKLVAKTLKLPKYVSLYSFTFGDVLNNGSEMLVVLTEEGKIRIFDSKNHKIWESDEKFGGSDSYIEYKGQFYNGDYNFQMSKMFIQQRILISDFDHKGKNAVFVVRNHDIASSYLANTRFFIEAFITSMIWDKTRLIPDERTQLFTGYFSDYAIADLNNDGKKELVFVVPVLRKLLKQKYSSRIYSVSTMAVKAGKKDMTTTHKIYKSQDHFKIRRMNPL